MGLPNARFQLSGNDKNQHFASSNNVHFQSWPQTELLMTFFSSTWRTDLYLSIFKGPCPWAAASNVMMALFPNANDYILCLEVYILVIVIFFPCLPTPHKCKAVQLSFWNKWNKLHTFLLEIPFQGSPFSKLLSSIHSPLYNFLRYFEWIKS